MHITNDPLEIPTREDGSLYGVALATPQATIGADTYDELLTELIPDYPTVQDTEDQVERADALRFAYLAQEADVLQEQAVRAAIEGGFLGEDADDEVKQVLTAPRHERVDVPGDQWDITQLPLILLTTHYAPFSDAPAPTGAGVVWLDPTDARTYVVSLATATGLTVHENPDADTPEE